MLAQTSIISTACHAAARTAPAACCLCCYISCHLAKYRRTYIFPYGCVRMNMGGRRNGPAHRVHNATTIYSAEEGVSVMAKRNWRKSSMKSQ